MYCKENISSYKTKLGVKPILEETWLEDESNHIKYRPIDLRWESYDF